QGGPSSRSGRFCGSFVSQVKGAPRAWPVPCRSWTVMRIAEVIGTVTLSRMHPSVSGFRWVIGVPLRLKALQQDGRPDGEDLVIYDDLGAGNGSRIGFSEGGEAAAPFH